MATTKGISRKDMAHMSGLQLMRVSAGPYKRLASYLKPYKGRFFLGLLFGASYGAMNALLMFSIYLVAAVVFPQPAPPASDAAAASVPKVAEVSVQGATAISPATVAPAADGTATDATKATEAGKKKPRSNEEHLADIRMKLKRFGFPISDNGQPSLMEVLTVSLLVPFAMLLRGLFSYFNSYFMLWTSQRVLNDIRQQVFGKIVDQSMAYFNNAKAGQLIQIVFNQTRVAQMALTTVASDIVKQPFAIISAMAGLIYMDAKFTLLALVLFPACIVPIAVVGKKIRKTGAREEQEAAGLMVVMQEAFAGIRVVKSCAMEDFEKKRFGESNMKMLRMAMRWQKASEMIGPAVEFVASFGVCLALVYAWARGWGPSKFIAMATGLNALYGPFKVLSKLHILIQKCLAATSKVFETIDTPTTIPDKPDAQPLPDVQGRIEFENVSFVYPKTKRSQAALKGFSLRIEPGKTYALVGASGAGKSTVLSLLLRYYDPTEGRVLIDGHDLRDIDQKSLRRQIGIVSQETFLFHDTVIDNIRYGKPGASKEEVIAAAKQAYAHEFIMEKPEKYQTVIGDKGSLLSGGQQQRISIARALLKGAPILLLDEATSALDSESEQKIQLALAQLSKGRTVIAIAHRLSTILNADQIVVMDHGKLVAIGTHHELYGTSPHYRTLYDMQFKHGNDPVAPAPVSTAGESEFSVVNLPA